MTTPGLKLYPETATELRAASHYLWGLGKLYPSIGPSGQAQFLMESPQGIHAPVSDAIMDASRKLTDESLRKLRDVVAGLSRHVDEIQNSLAGWEGSLLHRYAEAEVDKLLTSARLATSAVDSLQLGASGQVLGGAIAAADGLHWKLELHSLRALEAMGSHFYDNTRGVGVHTIPALDHYFANQLAESRSAERVAQAEAAFLERFDTYRRGSRRLLIVAAVASFVLIGAAFCLGRYNASQER